MSASTLTQTFASNQVAQPFGKYFLLERIGAGGMAEVFRAIAVGPENFQRTLVIKRILPHLSQDGNFVQMFIDEAKVSALLAHPNLVQVFEFGKLEGSFFIAMEYVHGRTVAATQKKRAKVGLTMPVAAVTEIGRQLCVGLDYAHSLRSSDGKRLGIVHRDITPSNLMLSFHGAVKILDFGIARVADELRHTHTQVGTLKGKLSYMSPEQIEGQHVDLRSDIFSLGVVLHELLSGRRLFKGDSDLNVSRMILDFPIRKPSLNNAAVPPDLDQVVMRALARDVNARYATAGQMASDLDRVMLDARMSPREHVKVLHDLFPGEVSAVTETGFIFPASSDASSAPRGHVTPRMNVNTDQLFSAALGGNRPSAVSAQPASGVLTSSLSGLSRLGRPPYRKRIAVGVLSILALATVVFVVRHNNAAPIVPGPTAAALPTAVSSDQAKAGDTVRCSLDSTPQDSAVIRVDSGKMLGRTPLTVLLLRSSKVVSFRFEKPGYLASLCKVIPDLDKAVRVDLGVVERTSPPKSAIAQPDRRSDRVSSRPAPARKRPERSSVTTKTGEAARNFRSATPVDPFAM